jgi:hypothetical protein
MAVASEKIDIVADQVTVFDEYANQINEWWPRRGETNRYSFAPDTTEPDRILFDAKEGDRYSAGHREILGIFAAFVEGR